MRAVVHRRRVAATGKETVIMTNHTNRLFAKLVAIAAAITFPVNRVIAAKLAIKKALGTVPEGAASYKSVCPKGAGHCLGHTMAEKMLVGSRTAKRQQRRFFKAHYQMKKQLA